MVKTLFLCLLFIVYGNFTCNYYYSSNVNITYININTTLTCGHELYCNHIWPSNGSFCPAAFEWVNYPHTYCTPYCCIEESINAFEIKFNCKCPPNYTKPEITLNESLIILSNCTNSPQPHYKIQMIISTILIVVLIHGRHLLLNPDLQFSSTPLCAYSFLSLSSVRTS